MGWSGVDLFFVLSGFLIGGICSTRASRHAISERFMRAGSSILPVFYASIALMHFGGHRFGVALALAPILFENPIPAWSYFLFSRIFGWGCMTLRPALAGRDVVARG